MTPHHRSPLLSLAAARRSIEASASGAASFCSGPGDTASLPGARPLGQQVTLPAQHMHGGLAWHDYSPKPAPAAPGSAVSFARTVLHFEPDEIQTRLLNEDSPRLIVNCARQSGKSTAAAARAIWEAETSPGSLVLVATPSGKQSGELVFRASELLRRAGRKVVGDGVHPISIRFANGSRIVGITAREQTARGFSPNMLIVDEAAQVEDELFHALLPMLAATRGRLWLLSTPWDMSGFFHEIWRAAAPPWVRVLGTAPDCPRISPEFLDEQRTLMPEYRFRREYMCEFTMADDRLFSPDLVQTIFRPGEKAIEL